MARAVFAIATNEAQAEHIVASLKAAGFSNNDISVLFPDKSGTRDFAHEQHTKAPEGAATGATTGGVLGGALGWLAGIGALSIPGLGPFIAAGPIMAALGGAAGQLNGMVGELRQPLDDFASSGLYDFTQLIGETRMLIAALTRISKEFERDPASFLLGSSQKGYQPK